MINTKCTIILSSNFKKQYKKAAKQGKKLDKIDEVIDKLAHFEILESKYRDHNLINDKYYKNCRECHIEPDWLLIYQHENDKLNLLLIATGSHSELFK